MARPVKADAEATRRRILEAATALFAERGRGSTPMRAIARRAGVSQACVHHYYGAKEQLYDACVAHTSAELEGLRAELWPGNEAAPQDLRALLDGALRRIFRFACTRRAAIRLNLRTVIDTGALDTRWRERVLLPFLDEVGALLAPLSPLPGLRLRLAIHSLQALFSRYALAAPEELAAVVGAGVDDPLAAVEDHLVTQAFAMLGLPLTD